MSNSRLNEIVAKFHAWWNIPINQRFNELVSQNNFDYFSFAHRLCKPNDVQECHPFIKELESQQNDKTPLSSHELTIIGTFYLVEKNYSKAKEYFETVTQKNQQGSTWALNCLGIMYQWGQGVPTDYQQAIRYYHQAVADNNRDSTHAQNNLGHMCMTGMGLERNDAEAFERFIEGDNSNGLAYAIELYLQLFKRGTFISNNTTFRLNKTIDILELAAQSGNYNALRTLGDIYADDKKIDLAAICWRAAATKNSYFSPGLLKQLKEAKTPDPERLYLAAIITKDKILLEKLSIEIENNPKLFINVASQDSKQKLLDTLGEINGSLLIELIIQSTVEKIAPRFNQIYQSLPSDIPADLVSIISSYEDKPASSKKSFNLFGDSAYKTESLDVHDDYKKSAWERCCLQAAIKSYEPQQKR